MLEAEDISVRTTNTYQIWCGWE